MRMRVRMHAFYESSGDILYSIPTYVWTGEREKEREKLPLNKLVYLQDNNCLIFLPPP
jgi:hypothetical protein